MSERYRVTLENTGETFTCAEDQNILRGMELLGRRGIPVGCRGGGCGVCKVHISEGEYVTRRMSREAISAEEEAEGTVLACRVFPRSDLALTVVGKMVKSICRGVPTVALPPGASTAPPPA